MNQFRSPGSDGNDEKEGWSLFRRPPRVLFHVGCIPGAALLLRSLAVPGIVFDQLLIAFGLILLSALAWSGRLIGTIVVQSRERGRLRLAVSPWFLVAPLAGALVVALALSSVPLRARWMIGEDEFAAVVAAAPPATSEWQFFDVPARIGTYRIAQAVRIPQGVLFYEAHGALFDDAGFAYLPGGPTPDIENGSFESPEFEHLGGSWYTWTAGW